MVMVMNQICPKIVFVFLFMSLVGACSEKPENSSTEKNNLKAAAETFHPVLEPSSKVVRRYPYFGDLHVHTAYSLDSYIDFNRVGPGDAYHFAQGGEVTLSGGRKLKLTQALDFAAVTDHSEHLGELPLCLDDSTVQYDLELCQKIRNEGKQLD